MATIHGTSRTPDVLAELGLRLRRHRLNQNRTAAEVAEAAGIGLRTVLRLEGGEGATLVNFLRVLRALGQLQALDSFLPDPPVSPMELVKREGKLRKRASSPDG